MRLAIDVSSAAKADPTGIGRYAVELVRNLAPLLGPDDSIRALVKLSRWRDRRHVAALGEVPRVRGPSLLVAGFLLRRASLFHATGVALPRGLRVPAAVTVPDVN